MVWCQTILGIARPTESLGRFGGFSCGRVATGRRVVPNLTGAREHVHNGRILMGRNHRLYPDRVGRAR